MKSYTSDAQDTTISQPRIPDWNWVRRDWRRLLAFGFGSGLAAHAPGTWGTLVALPLFLLLQAFFPSIFIFALTIPLFLLGVWVCDQVSRELGVDDHGGIVWDEIVAFLLVLSLVFNRNMVWWQALLACLLAFGLFRLFDIVKPFPIRILEKRVPGGLGIMLDDIFAAIYALLAFHLLWLTRLLWS